MKAVIVSSSVLHKYDRWDAAFYTGIGKEADEKVASAEKRIKDAQAALERAKLERDEEQKRLVAMREAGEIKPLD